MTHDNDIGHFRAIFFPRVILYTFFSFLLIYGGSGFGVLELGSWIGFLRLGFSVDGACGMGPAGFFGVGALYIKNKKRRINLGKDYATLAAVSAVWLTSD